MVWQIEQCARGPVKYVIKKPHFCAHKRCVCTQCLYYKYTQQSSVLPYPRLSYSIFYSVYIGLPFTHCVSFANYKSYKIMLVYFRANHLSPKLFRTNVDVLRLTITCN